MLSGLPPGCLDPTNKDHMDGNPLPGTPGNFCRVWQAVAVLLESTVWASHDRVVTVCIVLSTLLEDMNKEG